MVMDFVGTRNLAARWFVTVIMRLIAALKGPVVCAECGQSVPASLAFDFVMGEGCCGKRKLRFAEARALPGWVLPARWVLLSLAIFAFIAVKAPIGVDYPIFKGAAMAWVHGESRLFDAAAPGFYYAPWSLLLYAPLAMLPDWLASTLLNTLSVLAIVWAVGQLVGPAPWWVTALAIANIWTVNLVGSTQFDALTLGAVGVGWLALQRRRPWMLGLAWAVIGAKPTNAWLPALLLLAMTFTEGWSWKTRLQAAVLPLICVIAAFVIGGQDWPARYLAFVRQSPPNAGYNLAAGIGQWLTIGLFLWPLFFHIRDHGLDGVALALALGLNLLLSPYVTIYHYVLSIPLMVRSGARDSLWLVFLYVASLAWVMVRPLLPIYPVALGIAVMACYIQDYRVLVMAQQQ